MKLLKKALTVGVFCLLMLMSFPSLASEFFVYPEEDGSQNGRISGNHTGMGGFSHEATQQQDTPSPGVLEYVPGTYLLTTTWGQHGGYKSLCPYYYDPLEDPTQGQCRLGCWSVALAQIIRYYEMQSSGIVDYHCSNDLLPPTPLILPSHLVNFVGAHEYDWSLMPDSLTSSSSEEQKEMTSQFTFDVSCVVQKDFGTGGYVVFNDVPFEDGIETLKDELMDHFDDIEGLYWLENLDVITIITQLECCHPIMLYIRNISGNRLGDKSYHAVVLDGYQWNGGTFEVHLNYGWAGDNNGWYAYTGPFPHYNDITFRKALIMVADPPPQLLQVTQAGLIHTPYTYQAKTNHKNVSVVYYQFDWGDGSMSEWLGRYDPGEWCNASHSWNDSGVYAIRVRASDKIAWESNWSEAREFYIPKIPRLVPLVERLCALTKRFPRLEPLLVPMIERLCQ